MAIIQYKGFVLDQLESLNNKYVLANGYLGLTGVMDELKQEDVAHLKVNGLYRTERSGKSYLSVFNPFYTEIIVKGVSLHPKNILPKLHEQKLDLETGLFSRKTVYNINDVDIVINSERFLDQRHRSFLFSKYSIYTTQPIVLELAHGFDMDVIEDYKEYYRDIVVDEKAEIALSAKIVDSDKNLYAVYTFEKNFKNKDRSKKHDAKEHYIIKTEADKEYVIYKYAGISSVERKNVDYLKKALNKLKKDGYDVALENNKIHWAKLWKVSHIDIFSNDLVDRFTEFNQFQLISHRPTDDETLISRYGLTDKKIDDSFTKEMYIFRFFLNTDYKSARRMLMYRVNTLLEAKANAREIGKNGALYTDSHNNLYINALIAYNFVDYVERTMDKTVLDNGGLEMLLEISKFYLDYISLNAKKTNYQVLNVKTLDNVIDEIDNSALLNYLIRDCFGKTANMVALSKVDKRKEVEKYLFENRYDKMIEHMREARRKIYLQQPNVTKLIQIYDKYFKNEERLAFPDVLNLFFLFPNDFKEADKEINYLYYRKFSRPNPLGAFILSFAAITQGYDKEANRYFKTYIPLNLHDNASKINHLQDYLDLGLSAAVYHYLVYGMAGLKHDKYLLMADAFMPMDVRRLEFKVRIAQNVAFVKIKRNSAMIDWNENN